MSAPATTRPAVIDPWTERQIQRGLFAPGARGLTRCEAAHQYNEANCLTPADPDYLYTPGRAQHVVRALLALVGIEVHPRVTVVLTDADRTGPWCATYRVNPGQVDYASEQHRQITGETVSAHALIGALPWV